MHHSSLVMLLLLLVFAVIHSGGAALRTRAEAKIGARAWRVLVRRLEHPLSDCRDRLLPCPSV